MLHKLGSIPVPLLVLVAVAVLGYFMRTQKGRQETSSFFGFFIYLLLLKGFFLPLFIIPTGSMADTLHGANVEIICPNCGNEFSVGVEDAGRFTLYAAICPNCCWTQTAPNLPFNDATGLSPDPVDLLDESIVRKSGDRIVVHGWPYALGGMFGPQRWDVVVFKKPDDGQTNYIKRLVGLPGEKIEIINGDLFVNDQIERKPRLVQDVLWRPVYDHNYLPKGPSNERRYNYFPRFAGREEGSAWQGLRTRTPVFDGLTVSREPIVFLTSVQGPPVGRVLNMYGYNGLRAISRENVTDVRLHCEIEFREGDGFVELLVSKYENAFLARLHADARLTLEHRNAANEVLRSWDEVKVAVAAGKPTTFSLGVVDYSLELLIDGEPVYDAASLALDITPEDAAANAKKLDAPVLMIAAEKIRAKFSNLRVDRDIHYTGQGFDGRNIIDFIGVRGNPIQLEDEQYFVCGDNSPNSQDSRYWRAEQLGAHLYERYERGELQAGVVPADQMIGRAFFVYWPGFQRGVQLGPVPLLPDAGRIRWIQ